MKARLTQAYIPQITPKFFALRRFFARFFPSPVCQLPFYVFTVKDFQDTPEKVYKRVKHLGYPVFVKPANLGSSVGISRATNKQELDIALKEAFSYDRRIVVEKGLDRPREIEIAVLGNDAPIASVAGEITPDKKFAFYSYESKYTDG